MVFWNPFENLLSETSSMTPTLRSSAASASSSTLTVAPSSSKGFWAASPASATGPLTDAKPGEVDLPTEILIAQLLHDDLQEIMDSRKGKARVGSRLTDSDYALLVQSEQLEKKLTEIRDAEMALSLNRAMQTDRATISALALSEKVAQQDHEAALALSHGQRLPPITEQQRAIEQGLQNVDHLALDDMLSVLSPKSQTNILSSLSSEGKGKGKAVSFAPSSFSLAPSIQCVICDDHIPFGKEHLKAPCAHYYCSDCVVELVRSATRDESLYPVRCCKQNITTDSLAKFLPYTLLTQFMDKVREFSTPAQHRVYCCTPTCSAFLGNAEEASVISWDSLWGVSPATLTCDKCRVATCTECRQCAHPNDSCQQNSQAQQVREFARAQGWQTCPGCNRVIELHFGCNHMTCYCGYQFCYQCAARWKTCRCPQWEEARLYNAAEVRVERDLGERARTEAPRRFREQVNELAQNLRVNHDCYPNHRWRGGRPGNCEECGMYMPIYLKVCRECRLAVCKRCSFNRL